MRKIVNRYLLFIVAAVFAAACASTNMTASGRENSRISGLPSTETKAQLPSYENPSNIQCNDDNSQRLSSGISGAEAVANMPADENIVAVLSASVSEDAANEEVRAPETENDVTILNEGTEDNVQVLLDEALQNYEESQKLWSEGDIENSLKTLDQAFSLIVQVDIEKNPDFSQQVDDLRFMISKRILEIYASRYTVANGNYTAIPLVMNEHVQKEIRLFQEEKQEFFKESYKRAGMFRGEIVNRLRAAGLPEELSWLPLIESGFKVRALSRARALGLWQFIPSTGYKFGLKRDSWVDERLDPEKSTVAAIDYLKELHQIFGDWTTVLAAYNCGEGRVLRVIREQKINYLDNFWDLYEKLPNETARYVPRFLAVLHILNDPQKYGFTLDEPYDPIMAEIVSIQKQISLKSVAETLGVATDELTALNPELRYNTTPPSQYYLKVPHGTGLSLLSKIDEIPVWTPPQSHYVYHRVKRGETLSSIAQKYRTSVGEISRINKINKRHLIRAGQSLRIPGNASVKSSSQSSGSSISANGIYRVRKGDSLWLIAQRFNTTPEELQQINGLSSSRLDVGQVLKVTN